MESWEWHFKTYFLYPVGRWLPMQCPRAPWHLSRLFWHLPRRSEPADGQQSFVLCKTLSAWLSKRCCCQDLSLCRLTLPWAEKACGGVAVFCQAERGKGLAMIKGRSIAVSLQACRVMAAALWSLQRNMSRVNWAVPFTLSQTLKCARRHNKTGDHCSTWTSSLDYKLLIFQLWKSCMYTDASYCHSSISALLYDSCYQNLRKSRDLPASFPLKTWEPQWGREYAQIISQLVL